jgi:hypothetical protein
MKGPFALSINGALPKVLNSWRARLTWSAQRQHVAQTLSGMDSFFGGASFLSSYDPGYATDVVATIDVAAQPPREPIVLPVQCMAGETRGRGT